MTIKRKLLFSLIAFAIVLAAIGVVLEIVLRFLPVNEGLKVLAVNADNPVMRFERNRSLTWSKGGGFAIVAEKHSNNEGFLNDQDYDSSRTDPLLAVIGDSYVEAAQVDNAEAFHGLLAAKAKDRGRVYSFGASGCQLATYLVFADHAREKYKPSAMVISIVGNDFDESLWSNREVPGLHYFDEEAADRPMALRLLDYEPSALKDLGRCSVLVRYALLNADLDWRSLDARLFGGAKGNQFVGNTASDTGPERIRLSELAMDEFFRLLPEKSGLEPWRILFVLDGMRPQLYSASELAAAEGSYFGQMRKFFMRKAAQKGYALIDLQPVFLKHFGGNQRRFEFETDAHWNELGHQIVADQVATSPLFQSTFPAPQNPVQAAASP